MRFRRSRYYYWWQYSAVFVLAFLWMYARDRGFDSIAFCSGVAAAIVFIVLEFFIQRKAVILTKEGVDLHAQGAFLSYREIREVAVFDTRVGKFFRFGDVKLMGRQESVLARGVHDPARLSRSIRRKLDGTA